MNYICRAERRISVYKYSEPEKKYSSISKPFIRTFFTVKYRHNNPFLQVIHRGKELFVKKTDIFRFSEKIPEDQSSYAVLIRELPENKAARKIQTAYRSSRNRKKFLKIKRTIEKSEPNANKERRIQNRKAPIKKPSRPSGIVPKPNTKFNKIKQTPENVAAKKAAAKKEAASKNRAKKAVAEKAAANKNRAKKDAALTAETVVQAYLDKIKKEPTTSRPRPQVTETGRRKRRKPLNKPETNLSSKEENAKITIRSEPNANKERRIQNRKAPIKKHSGPSGIVPKPNTKFNKIKQTPENVAAKKAAANKEAASKNRAKKTAAEKAAANKKQSRKRCCLDTRRSSSSIFR